jgi:polysaccharide chain length determinant protein (PEP-CTERM system associated)
MEHQESINETLERLMGILRRQRWAVLTPILPITVIATLFAFRMQKKYTSQATLVIVQQRVSQTYVDPVTSQSTSEQVKAIIREILTRQNLIGIIDQLGLFRNERAKYSPDDLAEALLKDIAIEPDQAPGRADLTSVRIAYTATDPQVAQNVTSRLASLFIEQNLKVGGIQATTTARFMEEQLQAAKERLDQQERRLQSFRASNIGQLPQQSAINLSVLTDLRTQLQTASSGLARARQQRVTLEASAEAIVHRLRTERAALLSRFTAKHPDVVAKDQAIQSVESFVAKLKSPGGLAGALSAPAVSSGLIPPELRSQLEANEEDLSNFARDENRLRAEVAQYQDQLRLAPLKEQQLEALLRDYELYKKDYSELLNKSLRSQMTSTLEARQEGQQFRLVELPNLPTKPSGPRKIFVSFGGLILSIVVGLALALLRNFMDPTIHSSKEFRKLFGAPFVLGVPPILTVEERRARKWKIAVEWAGAVMMLTTVLAAQVVVYLYG